MGQQIGGGERVLLNQAYFLASRGHAVSLVTPGISASDVLPSVSQYLTTPSKRGLTRVIGLASAVRATRPDIVIAHMGTRDVTAAVAGRIAPKLAIYSHGGPFLDRAASSNTEGPRSSAIALAYRAANLVMTNSQWCARTFIEHRVDAKVVYPGVDVNFFKPLDVLAARETLRNSTGHSWLPDDECGMFLNVGWFRKNKNHELLIDALEEVVRSEPKARAVFIGRGRSSGIQAYANRKGLMDNLLFLQDIDDGELRLWYCAATAYVHMNASEHFGLPVAEAQSCGTPCIVPNVGGGAEIVESDRTGLFYTDSDTSSLARQMMYCLDHPQHVESMRVLARNRIVKKFNQDVVNSELEWLLNGVVARI